MYMYYRNGGEPRGQAARGEHMAVLMQQPSEVRSELKELRRSKESCVSHVYIIYMIYMMYIHIYIFIYMCIYIIYLYYISISIYIYICMYIHDIRGKHDKQRSRLE